jgi:hypothetical protein
MVLPVDAPTPRAYAERYDLAPAPAPEKPLAHDLEADMRDRLVEIGAGGTFLKVHAKSQDVAIVHWGFDYLLKKFSERGQKPPRLAVTRGAQWSRDSLRDYKIVGGKVIKMDSDDPDEEDEGIG